MTTKCHLISLTGQGDVHTILINDVAWEYLNNAYDGRPIPDELIIDYIARERANVSAWGGAPDTVSGMTAAANQALAYNDGGSPENDIAMAMGGSEFGGERWNNYGVRDLKKMMAFIAKHDLELDGEFEGSIY
jgi:hypothetical protein